MLKYSPGDSAIHRAGARAKLVGLIAGSLLLIAMPKEFSGVTIAAAFALYSIAGISVTGTVRDHAIIFVFSLAAFLFHWNDPLAGLYNYLFLCSLFLLSFLFVFTTPPSRIERALRGLGVPRQTAFVLAIGMASVPYFERKALRVRIAQAARGSKAVLPLVLPVLHSLFRRARRLAISLETRGFKP
ncbi:MAG: energy-coupling factor transporter transmembrane component T [Candidatus Micrarchaeota archaeon]